MDYHRTVEAVEKLTNSYYPIKPIFFYRRATENAEETQRFLFSAFAQRSLWLCGKPAYGFYGRYGCMDNDQSMLLAKQSHRLGLYLRWIDGFHLCTRDSQYRL